MADKSTTIISLPQMVDLALNSPEVGIVNFTVLHSLLHVIVNQLDLGDCNVEFRGSDSVRLQNYISTAKPGPIITLTEYTIGPDGKERKKKRRKGKRPSVEEKGKKDENQKEKEIAILKKEEEGGSQREESSGSTTIVVVEPASKDRLGDSPKFTIAMTKEQLSKLQKDIKDLQRQVKELAELPGNMGLIEALRGSRDGSNSPILDMFQILTLVKRMDATEVAMNKVATMLEDLAKGQSNLADLGLTPGVNEGREAETKQAKVKETGGKESEGKAAGGKVAVKETGGKDVGGKATGGKAGGGKETGGKPPGGKKAGGKEAGGKEAEEQEPQEGGEQNTGEGEAGGEEPEESETKESEAKEEKRLSFKEQSEELIEKSRELRKSLDNTIGGNNQMQELCNDVKDLKARVTNIENKAVTKVPHRRSSRTSENEALTQKSKEKQEPSETGLPTGVGSGAISEAASAGEGRDVGEIDINATDLSTLSPKDAITVLQMELLNLKEYNPSNDTALQALKEVQQLKESLLSSDGAKALPPEAKFGQVEIRLNDLKEQVTTLDTVYHQQFGNIRDGINNLDKEIAAVWERINSGLPAGDASSGMNGQNIQGLYNKLIQLQGDMDGLAETANKLVSEKEGRQTSLDVMIEQIELLKTVKADREDLEDALADKADACQINRKVSHEQFDAAYDEITKSLEITLDRLRKQEELWITSLDDLQKEMSNKLDKMELTPLKDFINSKLKGIQDKVKKITAMKQEHEAAGTKSKYLRNVNCISCDADVVMKKQMDITLLPRPYAMPASKNPGPYLAYELDLLRKQQKGLGNSKNINLFENALQVGKQKAGDKDHLCTRYCGGSHTITTPQQRVMRVGHFMEQWGPEIAPVNEVLIKGTDGHFYKGRDDAALRAAASERPPTPRVETPALTVTEYNVSGNAKEVKAEMKAEFNNTNQQGLEDNSSIKRPKTSGTELATAAPGKSSDAKRLSVRSAEGNQN